jgi:GTP diphosphokinase / guanosine-3',5'-bis(diphosphate) 3'-diphosphatase
LQIVRKVQPKAEEQAEHPSLLKKVIGQVRKKKLSSGVMVKGIEDILVRFGKCCQPVPGDPIVGYITRGFGVTVHRSGCINAIKTNPERLIEVQWDNATVESFPVEISISASDRMGLLADVAAAISKCGANIISANTGTDEDRMVTSHFTVAVENLEQLDQVIEGLKNVRMVQSVYRRT